MGFTADGFQIALGMSVFIWDDMRPVPTLDRYRVMVIHQDLVDLVGKGRMERVAFDQCYADIYHAIRTGFRHQVAEPFNRSLSIVVSHKVARRGVLVQLPDGWHRYGRRSPELAALRGKTVLVGRHFPFSSDQVSVYDVLGNFICTAYAKHREKERGR